MDPMELRRKNWIKHEEFPYTTIAGLTYDSGNYEAATEQGHGAVRLRRAARRAGASAGSRNDPVQLGIGISTFTEMCGLAPSRVLGCADVRRRRLGDCTDPDAADRQGRGRHRHVPARAGPRDRVEPDRRRRARASPFDDIEVIHGDTQSSPYGMDTYGSRSLVVGGVAVLQAAREGGRQGQGDRRAPAGGGRGRPRVRRRRVLGQGRAGPRRRSRRSRSRRSPRTTCPTAWSRRCTPTPTVDPENFSFPHGTHLCAVEVDTETGMVDDPQVRRGRRHRQRGQPDDRRGPGARRHGPGHRAGAVRGGGLRRRRQPGHRHDRRLPGAVRGRPAALHHRPDRDAVDDEPARASRASARPAPSRRTPAVVNAVVDALRHLGVHGRPMPCTPERVWRAIQESGSDGRRPGRRGHHRLRRPADRDDGRRCRMIPAAFDYVRPHSVDEAVAALGRGRRGRQGAGRRAVACCRCCGCGWRTRPCWSTSGGVAEMRGVREDGDALVIGAMTTHHDVMHDPLVAAARPLLAQATEHGGRPGGPAPRHLRRLARARRPGR